MVCVTWVDMPTHAMWCLCSGECFGLPLLITVPMKEEVPSSAVVAKVNAVGHSFVKPEFDGYVYTC